MCGGAGAAQQRVPGQHLCSKNAQARAWAALRPPPRTPVPHSPQSPWQQSLSLSNRQENQGSEKDSELTKVTELMNG